MLIQVLEPDCLICLVFSASTYKYNRTFVTTRKRSLGQGNIFRSVCQEFYPWGVCCSACWDTTSPQDQTGTPRPGRHPPGPGRHPPRPGRPPPREEHAGGYGQRVGGMHPTAMQSCSILQMIHRAV